MIDGLYREAVSAFEAGNMDACIQAFERVLIEDNKQPTVLLNMSLAYLNPAGYGHAIYLYKKACALDAGNIGTYRAFFARAFSSFLANMQYNPAVSRQDLYEAHSAYREVFFNIDPANVLGRSFDKPSGKIRLGYVSADFYSHPVGIFTYKLFEFHDVERFELYCYSNGSKFDRLTEHLKQKVNAWVDIREMDDLSVARRIAEDQIDLLIDLSGHTGGNRLGVFVYKPAPIQFSFLGYFDTTGLPEIDHIILGGSSVKPLDERYFSESIQTIPYTHFCYSPPDFAADVVEPPALSGGKLTFGCFNNSKKLSEPLICCWSQILRRFEHSQLLLKWQAFEDPKQRQVIIDWFKKFGVDETRLIFEGYSTYDQVLKRYGDVDIALDTFPFTGGLTTCDALYMGVPVVTLSGDRVVARQSDGILNRIGLGELVADSEEEYVRLAVELAGSLTWLKKLRFSLRERIIRSGMGDGRTFAKQIEAIYDQTMQNSILKASKK